MTIKCTGINCNATKGVGHSAECMQEHDDLVHPERTVIRKAIEAYCAAQGDPRDRCHMVVNATDMMQWLFDYPHTDPVDVVPEIFPGTRVELNNIGTIKETN